MIGNSSLSIRVDATAATRTLGRAAAGSRPVLYAELRRNLAVVAAPIASQIRMGAMHGGGPYESPHHTRARIAGSVHVAAYAAGSGAGVSISANAPLARAWDATAGWNHPVFGHREVPMVHQIGAPRYYNRPFTNARPMLQRAVENALKTMLQRASS